MSRTTRWGSGCTRGASPAREPLTLHPVDPVIAQIATSLAAAHRLRAADAIHLATAVVAGADRFVTNNRRDFPLTITEVDVTYPDML